MDTDTFASLRRWLIAGLLGALLATSALQSFDADASPARERPTPTYVSELGPAVSIGPGGQAIALPTTGLERPAPTRWPQIAGVGLALAGCALLYVALARRGDATG